MTTRIVSKKAKNSYGVWDVITVSKGGDFWFSSPWKFVFMDNRLRYVIIDGDIFLLTVWNLELDSRMPPIKQVKNIIPAINFNPDGFELLRMNDLGVLKYAPATLFRTLGIVGAPMLAINKMPGRNKRR